MPARIIIMKSEAFNASYPKWADPIEGKYDNLPRELFIIRGQDGYVTAIDNSTGDAWTEDFTTLEMAIIYLEQ